MRFLKGIGVGFQIGVVLIFVISGPEAFAEKKATNEQLKPSVGKLKEDPFAKTFSVFLNPPSSKGGEENALKLLDGKLRSIEIQIDQTNLCPDAIHAHEKSPEYGEFCGDFMKVIYHKGSDERGVPQDEMLVGLTYRDFMHKNFPRLKKDADEIQYEWLGGAGRFRSQASWLLLNGIGPLGLWSTLYWLSEIEGKGVFSGGVKAVAGALAKRLWHKGGKELSEAELKNVAEKLGKSVEKLSPRERVSKGKPAGAVFFVATVIWGFTAIKEKNVQDRLTEETRRKTLNQALDDWFAGLIDEAFFNEENIKRVFLYDTLVDANQAFKGEDCKQSQITDDSVTLQKMQQLSDLVENSKAATPFDGSNKDALLDNCVKNNDSMVHEAKDRRVLKAARRIRNLSFAVSAFRMFNKYKPVLVDSGPSK